MVIGQKKCWLTRDTQFVGFFKLTKKFSIFQLLLLKFLSPETLLKMVFDNLFFIIIIDSSNKYSIFTVWTDKKHLTFKLFKSIQK